MNLGTTWPSRGNQETEFKLCLCRVLDIHGRFFRRVWVACSSVFFIRGTGTEYSFSFFFDLYVCEASGYETDTGTVVWCRTGPEHNNGAFLQNTIWPSLLMQHCMYSIALQLDK